MIDTQQENNVVVQEDGIELRALVLKFKDWLKYLASKWMTFLVIFIVGCIAGFTYSYLRKPIYTATTTFVLEEGESSGGLGQYAGIAAIAGIDIGGGGGIFQGENIMELYRSRTMLQRALLSRATFDNKSMLLIDRYIDFNDLKKEWDNPDLKSLSFSDTAKFTILHDSIIGEVVDDLKREHLSVTKPDKKSSVLKVEFKSADQQFAKIFNDKIVATVSRFYIDTKTKKSAQNVLILQKQTDSIRAVMRGAIFSSASVVDATPNLNPVRQILRAPAQNSQFNAESNKAMLTELIKNLEISKMTLRKDMPLIQVLDSPIYPLPKDRIGKFSAMLTISLLLLIVSAIFFILKRIYSKLMHEK